MIPTSGINGGLLLLIIYVVKIENQLPYPPDREALCAGGRITDEVRRPAPKGVARAGPC